MIKDHFGRIFPFIIRDRWLNYSSVILVQCDWTTSVLVSSLTVSHDFTNDICFTGWLGIWNSKAKEKLERKKKKQPDTTLKPWMCSVELRFGNVKKKMSGNFSYIVPLDYTAQPKGSVTDHSFYHTPFISEHARAFVFIMHSINTCDFLTIVSWCSDTVEGFFSLHCLSLQYNHKRNVLAM